MKILEWITSFFAWLQIVASPLFFGVLIGLIVYGIYPTTIGLIVGNWYCYFRFDNRTNFCVKNLKKRGTIDFISRISASPELDNFDSEKN